MTDPTGKRALYSQPFADEPVEVAKPATSEGRRALFSDATDHGPRVAVECSSCGASVPVDVVEALKQSLTPGAWWVPSKRHNRLLRCTGCGHRTWCRVDWLAALRS